MEAILPGNKFAKDSYIISKRHRIFKVMITPPHCLLDDQTPGYLLMLVGSNPEHAFKMAKEKVEAEHDQYYQCKKEMYDVTPPRFEKETFIVHIASGGIYQITDLPTECVLEHNRKPAYGYRMPDGRRCFRAQTEVEDYERFARVDPTIAAMLLAPPAETTTAAETVTE